MTQKLLGSSTGSSWIPFQALVVVNGRERRHGEAGGGQVEHMLKQQINRMASCIYLNIVQHKDGTAVSSDKRRMHAKRQHRSVSESGLLEVVPAIKATMLAKVL